MAANIPIGRFSELTGLSQKTIRLYGNLGLLPPERVDAFSGYRYYGQGQVTRARIIARLRNAGISLREIAAFLEQPTPSRIDEWKHALEEEVARRLGHLEALQQTLAGNAPPSGAVAEEEFTVANHGEDDHEHEHAEGPRHFGAAAPVLRVPDVVAAAEYYRDRLGFEISFLWGEPPSYATTHRDHVLIHFTKSGVAPAPQPDSVSNIYVFVTDIDDVYEELKGRGAKIVAEPETWPYGMREFAVEDMNGYRLCFGEGVEES
jgi:DNA-binding transcriptional MerR regulator/predicted enzyme related to lactoylglutathione lyase